MNLDDLIGKLISAAEKQGETKRHERSLGRDFDLKKFNAENLRENRKLDQVDSERQRLSDVARLQSDTQRYGSDKSLEGSRLQLEGSRYGHDAQRDTAKMQAQTQMDIAGKQFDPGASVDRGYASAEGIAATNLASQQAASAETSRQKTMASIYQSVLEQTQDPAKAALAARSFIATEPKENVYDSDVMPSQSLAPEQQLWNSKGAEAAYQKNFGAGSQQPAPIVQSAIPVPTAPNPIAGQVVMPAHQAQPPVRATTAFLKQPVPTLGGFARGNADKKKYKSLIY